MNLRDLIQKIVKPPFGEDVIYMLSNTGKHILSSGKSAGVLTDERLQVGNKVITVQDDQNRIWILAGKK